MRQMMFEPLSPAAGEAVIDIFNHYVENGFAAYPDTKLPYEAFGMFLKMTEGYPTVVARDEVGKVAGFGMLRPYNPLPVFAKAAEITYFLAPEQTGKGLGSKILDQLLEGAREKGITSILASISSLNEGSIRFHARHGFTECGRFSRIGSKKGTEFDVIWMQRRLEGKELAATCGLYCGACTVYIATKEDPERLKGLAARFGLTAEAMACHGCRSDRRSASHCATCKIAACARVKGIGFCGECVDFPCDDLKTFQAERPHRIELWNDLARIKEVGHAQWLQEMRGHYRCPKCATVNSAYDLKCRKCGEAPSCGFVQRHGEAVLRFLANR